MIKNFHTFRNLIRVLIIVCLLVVIQLGVCFAAQKDTLVKRTTIKSVESVNDDYIQLRWSKVAKADGYQIYRAESKFGTYRRIATVKSSKRTYNDKKLEAGEEYYYKVRAYVKVNGKKKYGKFSSKVNYLPKKQGNVKHTGSLVVGSDGNPVLIHLPKKMAEGDVFATLDGTNNILLTGNIDDDTYLLKYENEDGTYTEIGEMEVSSNSGKYKIGKTPFIDQNVAPLNAAKIVVFDSDGKKVTTVPLGGMTRPDGEKLYSFGLVSDIHLYPLAKVEWTPEEKFRNALAYFQKNDCIMCIQCGDITQTGFYREINSSTGVKYVLDKRQMLEYKRIREAYTMPTYGLCGNHENYYGNYVADHPEELEYYMGKGATAFTISGAESTEKNVQISEVGNDVFILIGQSNSSHVMSDSDFQWLRETLEANKERRCFVFVHAYIEEDSGDAADVRENSIFTYWGDSKTSAFMNLLKQYDNVVLFHGHSHMKLSNQKLDENANYTDRNGFKSVHVPSLGVPRDVDLVNKKSVDDRKASEGYIVDVYDDCIVLNGRDFVKNEWIPMGVFKVDIVA